jgi:predicted ATP-dependent serine protease
MALICLGCGRVGVDPANGGRCACGALCWAETSPAPAPRPPPPKVKPPPSARLLRLSETSERMVVHQYEVSELARVLHGIRRGGTIILAGEAGAGKSTVAAELAAAVAEKHRRLAYWLDRDQQAHDLIAALFSRVHARMDRIVLVDERDPREKGYEPLTWTSALAHVPADAACVVIDSLETAGRARTRSRP